MRAEFEQQDIEIVDGLFLGSCGGRDEQEQGKACLLSSVDLRYWQRKRSQEETEQSRLRASKRDIQGFHLDTFPERGRRLNASTCPGHDPNMQMVGLEALD